MRTFSLEDDELLNGIDRFWKRGDKSFLLEGVSSKHTALMDFMQSHGQKRHRPKSDPQSQMVVGFLSLASRILSTRREPFMSPADKLNRLFSVSGRHKGLTSYPDSRPALILTYRPLGERTFNPPPQSLDPVCPAIRHRTCVTLVTFRQLEGQEQNVRG